MARIQTGDCRLHLHLLLPLRISFPFSSWPCQASPVQASQSEPDPMHFVHIVTAREPTAHSPFPSQLKLKPETLEKYACNLFALFAPPSRITWPSSHPASQLAHSCQVLTKVMPAVCAFEKERVGVMLGPYINCPTAETPLK